MVLAELLEHFGQYIVLDTALLQFGHLPEALRFFFAMCNLSWQCWHLLSIGVLPHLGQRPADLRLLRILLVERLLTSRHLIQRLAPGLAGLVQLMHLSIVILHKNNSTVQIHNI